ncbi:hypothetical protein KSP40_PGU018336 [Platanthera guangdongensis]|uniref:Uncharacterized protein n=1 Tax=Platanthera guangdongensis TaxID=2320717 RepID=A0ABR2LLM1_9ASPA
MAKDDDGTVSSPLVEVELETLILQKVEEVSSQIDSAKHVDQVICALHSLAVRLFPIDSSSICGIFPTISSKTREVQSPLNNLICSKDLVNYLGGYAFVSMQGLSIRCTEARYPVDSTLVTDLTLVEDDLSSSESLDQVLAAKVLVIRKGTSGGMFSTIVLPLLPCI